MMINTLFFLFTAPLKKDLMMIFSLVWIEVYAIPDLVLVSWEINGGTLFNENDKLGRDKREESI